MLFVQILLALIVLPNLVYLLWPVFSGKSKPHWVDYLPAASVALLFVQVAIYGFQGVLLGLYLFCLVIFLPTIPRLLHPAAPAPVTHRGRKIAGGLFGAVFLLSCLIPQALLPIVYETPVPTGEYAVGTVTYGWEDANRLEVFTPDDPADHRKIAVQFWYPTEKEKNDVPGKEKENARVDMSRERYPLLVFSHGAFGFRGSNVTTYMELASQGYIIASIDHAYHAFYTDYPDGSSAIISQDFLMQVQQNQSGQMSVEEDRATSFAWLDVRTADIRFTLDQAEALNAGTITGPLTGRMDLEKIGLFGHSLGGAASAAVCREDARCKASVVIDATMFGEYQREGVEGAMIEEPFPAPLMIFYNGDTFNATEEHLGYVPDLYAFEHAAGPAYGVVVNGAQHLNFTDLPARAPALAILLGQSMQVNGGTSGEIEQARCMEILNRYLLAFFDQSLLGKASPLLTGESAYAEVEFSGK